METKVFSKQLARLVFFFIYHLPKYLGCFKSVSRIQHVISGNRITLSVFLSLVCDIG